MNQVQEIAKKHHIPNILRRADQVNKACPVARVNEEFSPEKIALLSEKEGDELIKSPLIWECLTCGLCKEISEGHMPNFIAEVREMAVKAGYRGTETHGGMLLCAQQLNSDFSRKPNRVKWISGSLKVDYEKGDYVYWIGGAPFLNAVMQELKPGTIASVHAAIRVLNHLGIIPVILKEERFSGHDLLWTGDPESFKKLAEQNIQAITKTGAKKVIVSSPEDYYALAMSYRQYFDFNVEVCHISEFIAENLAKLPFARWEKVVTYHDPCRLGRGMGVYDAPRRILTSIPGVEFVEMENTKNLSLCCGTSCWTNCNRYSKLMQVNRLKEATATGAEIMVTTCWECEIHFHCTMHTSAWQQVNIEVKDLSVLASSLLQE